MTSTAVNFVTRLKRNLIYKFICSINSSTMSFIFKFFHSSILSNSCPLLTFSYLRSSIWFDIIQYCTCSWPDGISSRPRLATACCSYTWHSQMPRFCSRRYHARRSWRCPEELLSSQLHRVPVVQVPARVSSFLPSRTTSVFDWDWKHLWHAPPCGTSPWSCELALGI